MSREDFNNNMKSRNSQQCYVKVIDDLQKNIVNRSLTTTFRLFKIFCICNKQNVPFSALNHYDFLLIILTPPRCTDPAFALGYTRNFSTARR
jgi:hypothetical protein